MASRPPGQLDRPMSSGPATAPPPHPPSSTRCSSGLLSVLSLYVSSGPNLPKVHPRLSRYPAQSLPPAQTPTAILTPRSPTHPVTPNPIQKSTPDPPPIHPSSPLHTSPPPTPVAHPIQLVRGRGRRRRGRETPAFNPGAGERTVHSPVHTLEGANKVRLGPQVAMTTSAIPRRPRVDASSRRVRARE